MTAQKRYKCDINGRLSFDHAPVTSTWPHLNSGVGLEEGEY